MAQDLAQDLIAELHRLGIRLRLNDGRLDVVAPAGALTAELRDRLRTHRDELLAALRARTGDDGPPPVRLRPDERHEPFPLTDIQHAYWVGRGSAMELGGVSTHLYFELERTGLDLGRLSESLRKVIDRHGMLRAVVQADGRQRVLPEVPAYDIEVVDLRGADDAGVAAGIGRLRAELEHQVLPAGRWPLFDIRACLLDGDRVRLHVSIDVLILDGLSLYVLFGEWRRFYEDPHWCPEPLELSYRDHVLHEEALRSSEGYRRDEEYWLGRLESLPAAPALPLAVQPSRLERTRFARREHRMERVRWDALKERARERGLTASAVLMTAFCEVLRLWSTEPDFTLNLTLFNRPPVHPQINDVIGDFTTLTMLAAHDSGAATFTGRAEAVQRQLLRDLRHMAYNGVRVLRERARRLGGGPGAAMPVVFTSALVLGEPDEDPSAGLRFFGERVYGLTQTPQVWLDHQAAEEGGDLVLNWDAVEELFPAGLLDDMFGVYREVLDALAADGAAWDEPGRARLPRRQTEERELANATAAEVPDGTLWSLFEDRAAGCPDAVAVIDEDGTHTYREVAERSRRLARRLGALGTAPGSLVAVVLERGWRQVAAVLGVQGARAAYLPVDPQWPEARRSELLTMGEVRVVVTSPALRDALAWPRDVRVVTLEDAEVAAESAAALPAGPGPRDLAYVIYTSGSTGRPKGVVIDHRGAVNTVVDINRRFGVGPADRVLSVSALSFDLSVYDVFGVLAAGGTVVLPAPSRAQDPAHWTELADRHGVTVWNSVPALMQAWTEARGRDGSAQSALRLVLLSGDWIPVALPDAVRAQHPKAEVISLGGATEASIWSVCYPIGEVPGEWARIPYGKPLTNQTLHVYDAALRPCPVWTTGEIYIGGVGVARGYWADPERTAERFVVHPGTGERLYRTGDLGRYLPGGDIEFLGRQDHQVKINGYRIELDEIAAALRRQPGVGEAVVGVDTNPHTGNRQLVAHVVPAADGEEGTGTGGTWEPAVAAGALAVRDGAAERGAELAGYRGVLESLEALCPPLMARTLARLGAFTAVGDAASASSLVERHGLRPGYRALLDRWLEALVADGFVVRADDTGTYRCVAGFDEAALDERVRRGLSEVTAGAGERVLVDYFAACADHQVALLRGETSPLQLLLPGGDWTITEALYAGNPVSVVQNTAVARAVRAAVEAGPAERPVRILEVGAGTGATSAQLLAHLPGGRARYVFTDVSTYFTERARRRFADHAGVDYAVFDIDRDPAEQGYAPGSVDVVVAANVLHDARNLERTLAGLRSVLAPRGLLVLLEGTVNSLQQMVTVGFIEGLAQDHCGDRRLPLLPVAAWRVALEAAGFAGFSALPGEEADIDFHGQQVMIARAPDGTAAPDAESLRTALQNLLPSYMVPRHVLLVDRLPLNANGKVDRSALPAPWAESAVEERVAPRDEVERRLFAIWSEALGRDDFGVTDDFFDLGGDSLHAVSILGRLQEEFGLADAADEGLDLLFDHPSIAALGAVLGASADA
ncbi:amino acid adenylation domain-containing protein [Streptomyces sp. NPDC018693]|uniref:non-ribosomal peptide synthetase n=1 Tax=unclassified Streptomyces TaxID=2593676 RepID=UPI0037BBA7B8